MVFYAKENIILSFLWELNDHLSPLLKYHPSFVNTRERSFYQLPALKKFIIWTFPFMQSSCFCNNLFLSFIETYVFFNHFNNLFNLHLFLWISNGYSMVYTDFCGIRDLFKSNQAPQFCRNQNKDVSILTKTHIKLYQIHHIRNNWLVPIFFSPGDCHTKGFLALLHMALEGITEVGTDPKGRFVTFKVTLSNGRVLWVYASLGHSTKE